MSGERYDAVIVGSGFGGSINALRLAEAGRSVLVLERGRRYEPQDFPREVRKVDALLWRYPRPRRSRGLFDLRFMSGIATLTAAGVGGGSLIYASIHYRPRPEIFEDPRWPAPFDLDTLGPYYDRVAEQLGVAPVPAHLKLPKRDAFHRAAEAMGVEAFDTPQAVSWTEIFGAGEGRHTCQLCAECEFGCRYGAKNTLDFTYLAQAQARGAKLCSDRLVTHIAPDPRGGWQVHYEDLEARRAGVATGRRVIVAAGTLGTNEILLRSRDVAKSLPKLSARLGRGYSGNGDFLGNIQNAATPLDPWVGPDVTTVSWHHEESPGFVMATPTFNKAVMDVLASHGQPQPQDNPVFGLISPHVWRKLGRLLPLGLQSGLLTRPLTRPLGRPARGAGPSSRMVTVFAIGRDDADGSLVLREGTLDVVWSYARSNRALIARQRAAMRSLARHYGGSYADFPLWSAFGKTLTVHNLGGCALSTSIDEGVVGVDGQVHGHPGLFVADGSVIPTSIGSHPVMTISAVAEWIAERVVASF